MFIHVHTIRTKKQPQTNKETTCHSPKTPEDPLDLPEIPPWVQTSARVESAAGGIQLYCGLTKDTLDPINQFVTPDIFEGNGWPAAKLAKLLGELDGERYKILGSIGRSLTL